MEEIELLNMLNEIYVNLIVVLIYQHVCISKHHVVYLEYIGFSLFLFNKFLKQNNKKKREGKRQRKKSKQNKRQYLM